MDYYSNVPGPSLSLSMMQLDNVCSLRDGIEIVPHFHYIQEEEDCWVLLLPLYISSYNWRLLRLPQQFSTINSLYCFLFSMGWNRDSTTFLLYPRRRSLLGSPPSYVLRSRIDMDGLKGCCMCNSLCTVLTCNLILL